MPTAPPKPRPPGLKNVLFVVVDDLRPQIGAYHQNETLTPYIDSLAAQAMVFDRAYCQLAVCSPSRNSFLSGRRPDTTKVWNFKTSFRDVGAGWLSLPQWFMRHGYHTAGTGKVYHPGKPPNNDPPSWSAPYDDKGQKNPSCPPCPAAAEWCGDSWCSLERNATAYRYDNNDEWIAADGERLLTEAAASHAPFFVAVGIHKPHTPYAYPRDIDALYPPVDATVLPTAVARSCPEGMPAIAWTACLAIHGYNMSSPMSDLLVRQHRRAYYAAVTHTDRLIGGLLRTLAALNVERSTMVVVTGDHGYELGEHDMWCKKNNFELGVRVPLIIKVPWLKGAAGIRTQVLAELVDLYPTMAELAGLPNPIPSELGTKQGVSLAPVFLSPDSNHSALKPYAFSQYPRCGAGPLIDANKDWYLISPLSTYLHPTICLNQNSIYVYVQRGKALMRLVPKQH